MLNVGVEAFLPGSQVDIIAPKDLRVYEGKTLECKIVKLNEERKNVVLSRRELIDAERAEKRSKLLGSIEKGSTVKGRVKNITDFGAFIDLDGLDGLLHITDMSWSRLNHPSEMLKVGQEVEVLVLDIDHEKERVSLGLKQKTAQPAGKGLVHGSDLSWGNQIADERGKHNAHKLGDELLSLKASSARDELEQKIPATVVIHDFIPLEGGRLNLKFHQKPDILIDSNTQEFEVAGWNIKLPLKQSNQVNQVMARKFAILSSKADANHLSDEEQLIWLSILDQIDYVSYCIRRAAPHYLEGELRSLEPECVIEWADGRIESLAPEVAACFSELQVGDTFGVYVKLGHDNKALLAERVTILESA
jgi:predicted RNA-binding protein with RPS1 domain